MSDSVFLDTNILVYVFDDDSPEKQSRARDILQNQGAAGEVRISTQVLQEFYVTVARKLARPLSPSDAEQAVVNLTALPIVQVDTLMVVAAVAGSQRHQLSFWDALIVQAALRSSCSHLLTEDMQHDQVIEGLTIQNPFLTH